MGEVAELIVALERGLTSSPAYQARSRGWCGACGHHVLLTPGGYLKSHSYFISKGQRGPLFSWEECLRKDGPPRAIIRCHGGGNRPRKKEPRRAD